MKKHGCILCMLLSVILFINNGTILSAAAIRTETIKLSKGRTYSAYKRNCTYETDNAAVAYVNADGIITGKKKGTATISVRKGDSLIRTVHVTVKASTRRPNMGVCYDELQIEEPVGRIVDNSVEITHRITNHGTGSLRKIIVDYAVTLEVDNSSQMSAPETDINVDPEQGVSDAGEASTEAEEGYADAEKAPAGAEKVSTDTEEASAAARQGETAAITQKLTQKLSVKESGIGKGDTAVLTASWTGDETCTVKQISSIQVKRIRIYSSQAVIIAKPEKDKWTVGWGMPDTTKPVISGLVGKDAYNSHYKEAYRTVYRGNEDWLLKYVSARDDRDGQVEVEADTSKVNWEKKGVYPVTYSARDSAGNVTQIKTRVQVRLASDSLDRSAQKILNSITKENWSDERKARAIYRYVREHMSYAHRTDHSDWERAAQAAVNYQTGDCFYYYSWGRLLLSRCGIPNQTITRINTSSPHWWNYVYMENKGWYHFDITPRLAGGRICLKTSAWLSDYSDRAGNSHIWNHSWVPDGAEEPV